MWRIKDWDALYENSRSRELKVLSYVPVPNKQDGEGFLELIEDHQNGPAHLGAWLAILQIASKCTRSTEARPYRDGTLRRRDGTALDCRSLARKSHLPAELLDEVMPRLVSIGWIEVIGESRHGAEKSQPPAEIPHLPADRREQKGTERKAAAPQDDGLPLDQFFEERYAVHPKKRDRVLAQHALIEFANLRTLAGQEDFRKKHNAWITTQAWRDKGGSFAPSFAAFVKDRTWQYFPPEVDALNSDSKRKSDGTDPLGYFDD